MCLPDEDQAGALTFTQSYGPCGVVTYTDGTSQIDYGYTGWRDLDPGMGEVMDYKARFYSPYLSRLKFNLA
jgi:hypothetical protein